MKIDNVSHSAAPQQVEHGKGKERVAGATAQSATAASTTHLDRVGGNAGHDIDQARVAELRQAISEGRLAINTDRIADRLLDGVRDMLGDAP